MAPLRLILVVNLIEIKEQMNRYIVLNSTFGLLIKLILENMIYIFSSVSFLSLNSRIGQLFILPKHHCTRQASLCRGWTWSHRSRTEWMLSMCPFNILAYFKFKPVYLFTVFSTKMISSVRMKPCSPLCTWGPPMLSST